MSNLFVLLFLPVISAIVLAFIGNKSAKWIALVFSLVSLGMLIPIVSEFNPKGGIQFESTFQWIEHLGIAFHVGIDGISLPLVLLTNVLIPLIILSTFNRDFKGNFYALILFMQAGLLLVFTALNGFAFYVGWEAALIPIYFICALWGEGDRVRVNLKFFVYTFLGSIFMLIALIFLYRQTPGHDFEWLSFSQLSLSKSSQLWIFGAFFLAFAIKIPLIPFHTWQPDTYTNAPAAGTMLLSGIMLKMGVFGFLRWVIPITPMAVFSFGHIVMFLCVAGVVYASIIAFQQQDAKRLIAYSSIAHVGLITAGVFSLTVDGIQGAIFQMVNHGISVVGLFLVIDIIERRTGTRVLDHLGGLASKMQRLAIVFLIIAMGAVGLPLTNGFVGEFLLLKGIFNSPANGIWYVAFGGLTLILGAVYMLRFYQKTMLGELRDDHATVKDVSGADMVVLSVIVLFILILGVVPNYLLDLSEPSVNGLLQTLYGIK